VLFVLIPAALVAVALLGLSMCRLAARSDSDHGDALAEWMDLTEHRSMLSEHACEQIPFDSQGETFGAAG